MPLHWPNGDLFGTLCALDPDPGAFDAGALDVLHTVADLIQHELAAQERKADRERWLDVLAHDLRSPLTGIDLAAVVLERGPPAEILGRVQRTIRRNVATMQEMIDALMDHARHPSPERVILQKRPVDLARWLEILVEDAGLPVVLELDASLGAVEMDGERMGQAVRNLLTNAATYRSGDDIVLRANPDGAVVRLQVENAVAAPVHDAERLFEPYVRGSISTRGVGLGLFLCRLFVRAHGGEASASCRDGRFVVDLTLPRSRGASTR